METTALLRTMTNTGMQNGRASVMESDDTSESDYGWGESLAKTE